MRCCIKSRFLILLGIVASLSARADFNEATRAYLRGDFEKARYEALVDATDGKPEAQMLLGQLYFNGEGVEKDIQAALYWYDKAASQGFVDAQYRLGLLYFEGKPEIPKDYDKAYQWLQQALKNGNNDAKPKLEGLYKTDSGKVVNLHESPEILQQVASTGNKQARFLYSEKLLKGDGYPQDKAKAIAMLTEDAHQGFVKAQKRLGELYYYGDGVPQDYYEAYAWSMAYAGTKELGGLMREGKQTARSALRKLDDENHVLAYEKSREYFEKFVLPFHKNAREVGPDKYRIVVRSRKAQLAQAQQRQQASSSAATPPAKQAATVVTSSQEKLCASIQAGNAERTKKDVSQVFDRHKGIIYATYDRALRKKPDLKGKVEYEIEIAPSGDVTSIKKRPVSTLEEPEFEAQLVAQIQKIDFCTKGSKPFMVAYPIEFIPPGDNKNKQMDPVLARTIAAVESKQGVASGKTQVVDHLRDNIKLEGSPVTSPSSTAVPMNITQSQIPEKDVKGNSAATEAQPQSLDTVAGSGTTGQSSALATTALESAASTSVKGSGKTAVIESSDDRPETIRSPATSQANVAVTDSAAKPQKEERSYPEVYNVFTRHKSRINELYLRAYEQDKRIHGRIVFELTINSDGTASSVGIQSSELESPALEEELIDYIKTIDFGKKNAAPFDVTYPLDFLP
ncbi:AgmX/PglI C-terminal domain-containing protein [Kaarinaea lacus]